MVEKNIESIRKPILLPLAMALFALLAVSLYGMHYVQQQNSSRQAQESLSQAQQVFLALLQDEAQHVSFAFSLMEKDDEIFRSVTEGRRDDLYRHTFSSFHEVFKQHGISEQYFIQPDGRILLRVHDPERFGDITNQVTLVKSQKQQKQAVGLEVGDFGKLSLKAVFPLYSNDGDLIGFVEFGKEISPLARKLKKLLGAEVLFSVDKKYISKEKWDRATRENAEKTKWNDLPRCVVVDHTFEVVPQEFCGLVQQTSGPPMIHTLQTRYGGRKYLGGHIPLVDAEERVLGSMTILKDVSNIEVSVVAMALYTGFSAIAVMLCVYLFFSWYVKRMDSRIMGAQESLQEALTDRESRLRDSVKHLQETLTKQKSVEQELQLVCLRNQLILDSVGEGIFGVDTDGRYTFANPLAVRLLGYAPGELTGKPCSSLWARSADDEKISGRQGCPIAQSYKSGKVYRVEDDVFLKRDGVPFPVSYISTPIWESGKLTGAVVCFRDISKQQAAKSALEESERLYRAITTTVLDAIIMTDEEDVIIYWNRAAEKIFGFSVNDVIGKSFHDFILSSENREIFQAEFSSLKGAGGQTAINGKIFEVTGVRKEGKIFPCEVSLSAVEMAGEWCAVAIVRDITERYRAQQEWQEMQAQLRQSQKMEAIGTLAGGIAHDFNNILGAIMGYTELALLQIAGDDPLREHLSQVQRASRRAKDLVNHILAFSRQSELTKKPLDVTPIIKEALKMLRASLPTTIDIKQEIEPDIGKVMADPTQIHQVLMNLCTNSAQAMSERGGELTVSLRKEIFSAETLLSGYHVSPGEYLCLSVTDNGCGMDDTILSRIFDPFFTTKKRGEGTGMGLSVVHGIVSSHEGGIRVLSTPGEGTTFDLFFPIIESKEIESAGAVAQPLPTGTECVLLVDDEPTLIELGQRALSYLGYEVVSRTGSVEALELFSSQPEKFDLVITDYTMPHMTGTDLARKMLAVRPGIPIILCTGFSEKVSEAKAKAMGIRGYVMKPVSIHELAKACREVLDNSK